MRGENLLPTDGLHHCGKHHRLLYISSMSATPFEVIHLCDKVSQSEAENIIEIM